MLYKTFVLLIFVTISSSAISAIKDHVFKTGRLLLVGPPLVNKDYFLLEYGFVTDKKIKSWDYQYNAYVTATLFQDWLGNSNQLRAGALGFKAGFILPFQPWIPLEFTITTGFAKTVLHKNPFLGRDHLTVAKKDMVLLESGLLYHYDNYFFRFSYFVSNVKYFKRHALITMGVVY